MPFLRELECSHNTAPSFLDESVSVWLRYQERVKGWLQIFFVKCGQFCKYLSTFRILRSWTCRKWGCPHPFLVGCASGWVVLKVQGGGGGFLNSLHQHFPGNCEKSRSIYYKNKTTGQQIFFLKAGYPRWEIEMATLIILVYLKLVHTILNPRKILYFLGKLAVPFHTGMVLRGPK